MASLVASFGPVWHVATLPLGHPIVDLGFVAAAVLLLAKPNKASYRA